MATPTCKIFSFVSDSQRHPKEIKYNI
jgi:hypothetical protein